MSEVDALTHRADIRTRVIEMAARMLKERGPSAVTTRGVAEAAGLQAPTIYRLFGDKEGLMDAVAEHVLTTFVATKVAAAEAESAADGDPIDDLRVAWRTQMEFGVGNPALFALLSDPARGLRMPAARSAASVLDARIGRLARAGLLRVTERRAAELIRAAGTGAVLTILSTAPEQRDLGLADDAFEAVIRQITTGVPERPAREELTAAVAFRAIAPRLDMLTDPERQLLVSWLDRVIDSF